MLTTSTIAMLARALREQLPNFQCFSCFGKYLGISEPEVRGAAQALVFRQRFRAEQRVCCVCQRVDDTLVPHEGSGYAAVDVATGSEMHSD